MLMCSFYCEVLEWLVIHSYKFSQFQKRKRYMLLPCSPLNSKDDGEKYSFHVFLIPLVLQSVQKDIQLISILMAYIHLCQITLLLGFSSRTGTLY